jgi:glycosyltransferase involved in cell wall biosynthesis
MARKGVITVVESLGRGGAERLVVTTMGRLQRHRFEPRVATLFGPSDLAEELRAMKVPVHELGMRGPVDIPRVAFKLRNLIRHTGAEVVHTHLYFANIVGRLATRGSTASLVTTLHNPDYTHDAGRGLRFRGRKALDRFTLRRPGHLLAVSEEVRRDYQAHFDLPDIEVLYNFIDMGRFQEQLATVDRAAARRALGVRNGDVVALHVGRFHRQKAQDHLLRALQVARVESPGLRLFFAGGGSELSRVRSMASEMDVGDAVVFLGPVSDVMPLYRAADLFVFPSRFEAFGMALLESMAAGLPSVATRAGGILEVATERTTLLVGIDHVTELARALVRLAEDPGLRQRLGAAAVERARDFDFSRWLPRLEEIYEGR